MHNGKFDLHMLHNFGTPYPHKNILDTMTIARLVLEAKTIKEGGDALGLKQLADKYIEAGASKEQKDIKRYKAHLGKLQLKEWQATVLALGFDVKDYSKPKMEKYHEDPVLEIEEVVPLEIAKA